MNLIDSFFLGKAHNHEKFQNLSRINIDEILSSGVLKSLNKSKFAKISTQSEKNNEGYINKYTTDIQVLNNTNPQTSRVKRNPKILSKSLYLNSKPSVDENSHHKKTLPSIGHTHEKKLNNHEVDNSDSLVIHDEIIGVRRSRRIKKKYISYSEAKSHCKLNDNHVEKPKITKKRSCPKHDIDSNPCKRRKGRKGKSNQINEKSLEMYNKSSVDAVSTNSNHQKGVKSKTPCTATFNTKVSGKRGTLKYLKERQNFLLNQLRNEKEMDIFDSSFGKKSNMALCDLLGADLNEPLTIKTPKEKDKFKGTCPGLTPRSALLSEWGNKILTPSSIPTSPQNALKSEQKGTLQVLYHHLKQNNRKRKKKGPASHVILNQPSKNLKREFPVVLEKLSQNDMDSSFDDYFNESL